MAKGIQYSFHYAAGPLSVIRALTEEDAIRKWWTQDAEVIGSRIVVKWQGLSWTMEMEAQKSDGGHKVIWFCHKSGVQSASSEGSIISFDLVPDDHGTRLDFNHSANTDPAGNMCFPEWHYYLGNSLKAYVETGQGMPYQEKPAPQSQRR